MPIVEAVSSSISVATNLPPGVGFNDLVSWGFEGLIKAQNNFEENKGSQFKTYAYYRIKGEILDRLRKEWNYRNPSRYKAKKNKVQDRMVDIIESQLDASSEPKNDKMIKTKVDDLISNTGFVYLLSTDNLDIISTVKGTRDPSLEVVEEVESNQDRHALWREIQQLTEEEKKVIDLFYIQGLKQKEIAEELSLSRSKVCRLHMKILSKLKRRLLRREQS